MKIISKILVVTILIQFIITINGNCFAVSNGINYLKIATLNSTGANFKVRFDGMPTVSDENKIEASITEESSATINVKNLVSKGDYAVAKYTVRNDSTDLYANLSVETQNSNEEYFDVESKIEKNLLTKGESTTIEVMVKLIKTPINDSEKSVIKVNLTATPVQPSDNDKNDTNQGQQGSGALDATSNNEKTVTNSPFTGDNLPIIILIIVVVVIINILLIIIRLIKRKNKEKNKKM